MTRFLVPLFLLLTLFTLSPKGKKEEQPSLQLQGRVIEKIYNRKTLSEYTLFYLVTDGESYPLFNEKNVSRGFDQWVGSSVFVEYEIGQGFVGFKSKREEGLIVLSIKDSTDS